MRRGSGGGIRQWVGSLHLGQVIILNILSLLAGASLLLVSALLEYFGADEFWVLSLIFLAPAVSLGIALACWWMWLGEKDSRTQPGS